MLLSVSTPRATLLPQARRQQPCGLALPTLLRRQPARGLGGDAVGRVVQGQALGDGLGQRRPLACRTAGQDVPDLAAIGGRTGHQADGPDVGHAAVRAAVGATGDGDEHLTRARPGQAPAHRCGQAVGVRTNEALRRLWDIHDAPWRNYAGEGLTDMKLAELVRPYGVGPKQFKVSGKNLRGYRRDDLEEGLRTAGATAEAVTPLPTRRAGSEVTR